MKFFLYILLSILCLSACDKRTESDHENLAAAYVDVSTLAVRFQHSDSSFTSATYEQEMRSILLKHGMTPEQFKREIDSLAQRPEEFRLFTERVTRIAAERR